MTCGSKVRGSEAKVADSVVKVHAAAYDAPPYFRMVRFTRYGPAGVAPKPRADSPAGRSIACRYRPLRVCRGTCFAFLRIEIAETFSLIGNSGEKVWTSELVPPSAFGTSSVPRTLGLPHRRAVASANRRSGRHECRSTPLTSRRRPSCAYQPQWISPRHARLGAIPLLDRWPRRNTLRQSNTELERPAAARRNTARSVPTRKGSCCTTDFGWTLPRDDVL